MKAILLAGGYGTRLFPLTLRTPKCLLPVAGKPVLIHLIELLKRADIRDIVISLSKTQTEIESYLGDGEKVGAKITYVHEETTSDEDKLGGIGAIGHVIERIGVPDECLIIGGDNFIHGLNIKGLLNFHRDRGSIATIALFELEERELVQHYGVALIDDIGKISRFQEKPRVEEAVSNLVSTAIYCLNRAFLERHLPRYLDYVAKAGRRPDRIGDLWEYSVKHLPIYGYVFSGIWADIGDVEAYIQTNNAAQEFIQTGIRTSNIEKTARLEGGKTKIERDVIIKRRALIRGPAIIGAGCVVGEESIIGPYVSIAHGCSIGRGSVVNNSIIFEGVKIGKNSTIMNCVIDGGSRIGDGCELKGNSIMGYRATLGNQVSMDNRSRIWPFVKVREGSSIRGDIINPESEEMMKELSESRYWL